MRQNRCASKHIPGGYKYNINDTCRWIVLSANCLDSVFFIHMSFFIIRLVSLQNCNFHNQENLMQNLEEKAKNVWNCLYYRGNNCLTYPVIDHYFCSAVLFWTSVISWSGCWGTAHPEGHCSIQVCQGTLFRCWQPFQWSYKTCAQL